MDGVAWAATKWDYCHNEYNLLPHRLRTEHFEFPYPFRKSPYAFLVSKHSSSSSESAGIVFQVFHPVLWTLLLAAATVFGVGVVILARLQHGRAEAMLDSLWAFFRILINQYEATGDSSWTEHMLFLCGSLITQIFLPLYQNGLLAQLLLPRSSDPFQSAAGLVDGVRAGRFRFVRQQANAFYQEVALAENSFT